MTMPITTNTTIAICIQIHVGGTPRSVAAQLLTPVRVLTG
jgi:hypothetical protein